MCRNCGKPVTQRDVDATWRHTSFPYKNCDYPASVLQEATPDYKSYYIAKFNQIWKD